MTEPLNNTTIILTPLAQIADKYDQLCNSLSLTPRNRTSLIMDMASVEQDETIEMDWQGVLEAKEFDFFHVIGGIIRHMDRSSYPGKLTGCFVPRFAK